MHSVLYAYTVAYANIKCIIAIHSILCMYIDTDIRSGLCTFVLSYLHIYMYKVSHTQSVHILNGLLHKLVYRGLYMCIMVHASIYMHSMNQHIHTHTHIFFTNGKIYSGFSNKLSLPFTVKGRRRPASHCRAGENRRSFPGLKVRKNLTCSVCSTRLTRLVWQSLQLIHVEDLIRRKQTRKCSVSVFFWLGAVM